MKSIQLLEQLQFSESRPMSEALLGDEHHRILRFCLRPGQQIDAHSVPHSSLVLVVLSGRGEFSDGRGRTQFLGPNSLMVFEPAETHMVRALDEDLVFVALLQGVGGTHAPVGTLAETP